MTSTAALGAWGEAEAARHLEKNGVRIVDRHYQTRWGEIDLIGRRAELWIFVEVKTRTLAWQPSAADAITPAKQKRLVRAALSYMKKHRLEGHAMRFDAVLIEEGKIEWLEAAFDPVDDFTF